jgi:hypothetical protein
LFDVNQYLRKDKMTTVKTTNIYTETAQFAQGAAGTTMVSKESATLRNAVLKGTNDFTAATVFGLGAYTSGVSAASLGGGTGVILSSSDTVGNMSFRRLKLIAPLEFEDGDASILKVTFANSTTLASLTSTGTLNTNLLTITGTTTVSGTVTLPATTSGSIDVSAVTSFTPELTLLQVWTPQLKGDMLTFNATTQDALTHPLTVSNNQVLIADSTRTTGLRWGTLPPATVQNISQLFPLSVSDAFLLVDNSNGLNTLSKFTGYVGVTGMLAQYAMIGADGTQTLGARYLDPVTDTISTITASAPMALSTTLPNAAIVAFNNRASVGAAFHVVGTVTTPELVMAYPVLPSGANDFVLDDNNINPSNAVNDANIVTAGTNSIALGEIVGDGDQAFFWGGSDITTPILQTMVALPTTLSSTWVLQQVVAATSANSSYPAQGGNVIAETTGMIITSADRVTAVDSFGSFDTVSFTLSIDALTGIVIQSYFPAKDASPSGDVAGFQQTLVSLYFPNAAETNAGVLSWTYSASATAFILRYKTPSVATGTYYMQATCFMMV